MLKILKVAALSLLVSTGMVSAATIFGTASIGGLYTSDTDPLAIDSVIEINGLFVIGEDDYLGASAPTAVFDIVATVGANVGTAFTFPDFDFVIDSTTYAFIDSGVLTVAGYGTASGTGYDSSISSWVLSISGDNVEGAFSLFIETPPGDIPTPSTVPVPAGLPLLVGGLAMFGFLRKRATT